MRKKETRELIFSLGQRDIFIAIEFMATKVEGCWILKSSFMEELRKMLETGNPITALDKIEYDNEKPTVKEMVSKLIKEGVYCEHGNKPSTCEFCNT